jgi:hypothetical protein
MGTNRREKQRWFSAALSVLRTLEDARDECQVSSLTVYFTVRMATRSFGMLFKAFVG